MLRIPSQCHPVAVRSCLLFETARRAVLFRTLSENLRFWRCHKVSATGGHGFGQSDGSLCGTASVGVEKAVRARRHGQDADCTAAPAGVEKPSVPGGTGKTAIAPQRPLAWKVPSVSGSTGRMPDCPAAPASVEKAVRARRHRQDAGLHRSARWHGKCRPCPVTRANCWIAPHRPLAWETAPAQFFSFSERNFLIFPSLSGMIRKYVPRAAFGRKIRSGIEVVITALTRNQVYRQRYRGFESHPLRYI